MEYRLPRLWKQYGQLLDPQAVEGKFSPDLWRTPVSWQVFEQRGRAEAPGIGVTTVCQRLSIASDRVGGHSTGNGEGRCADS